MTQQDTWLTELRIKQAKEEALRLEKAKKEAVEIGKELFNVEKLSQYWTSPHKAYMSDEEYAKSLERTEKEYYLSGKKFMTIEAFGKYLVLMETHS